MSKVVHLIGNGDQSPIWHNMNEPEGIRLVCNMPPFPVDKVYATCMVDFKMMAALTEGHVNLDMYNWVLGNRPKIWMGERQSFYLKYAQNIKDFYLTVPEYAGNATNFNCGHMATHFAATKFTPKEVHLYGFDTLFDFNMRSITDLYLSSDRGDTNNFRLLQNWRPIWYHIFKEFEDQTTFVLHHTHDDLKIPKGKNVEIVVHNKKKKKVEEKKFDTFLSEEELNKLNRKERRVYESRKRKGKLK